MAKSIWKAAGLWALVLAGSVAWAGEFELKLSPEYGYFGSSAGTGSARNYSLFAGHMAVGYRFRQTRQHGQIQLRFRPEQYGLHSATTILNWNGNAEYYRQWGSTQWGVVAQRRRMNFYRPSGKVFLDVAQVSANGQWQDTGLWSTEIQFTYQQRALSGDARHTLSTPFTIVRARYRKSNQLSISMGFYVEQFRLKIPSRPQVPSVNKGWGVGPEINFEVRNTHILNASYLAIFRDSDAIRDVSQEHRVSMLAGRTIGERMSIFLFADYTFRVLDDRNEAYRDLYYHSSNNESRFYLKLGYDITRSIEAFVKTGYVRYELYDFNSDFSGTHLTVGVSAEL